MFCASAVAVPLIQIAVAVTCAVTALVAFLYADLGNFVQYNAKTLESLLVFFFLTLNIRR